MKKIASWIGIAVCALALAIAALIALVVYAKKMDSDCRKGEGEKGAAACSFLIDHVPATKYVPIEMLRWAYRYSRAGHYYETGKVKEALSELDGMIGMYENDRVSAISDRTALHVYDMAAFYHYRAGNLAAAGKYADAAIRKGSEKMLMLVVRADSLLLAGQYREALADLRKAADAGYPKAEFYSKQGLAYRGLGEDEPAYASLTAAEPLTASQSKKAVLNKEIGFVCYSLKRYNEALARLKAAVSAGVKCPECPALIAKIEKALERPARPASPTPGKRAR